MVGWTNPRTWVASTILTAAQLNTDIRDNLNYLRSSAQAFTATSETTTSATYADLATAGPSVTVTTDVQAIVLLHSFASHNTTNGQCYVGFDVSGATTIAASDAVSAQYQQFASGTGSTITGVFLVTGLTAGSNTFKLRYRTNTGTATYYNRRITIIPS